MLSHSLAYTIENSTDKPFKTDYTNKLNKSINAILKDASIVALKNPKLALFTIKTIKNQIKALKKRKIQKQFGVNVPPFLITSITNRCNLSCAGCYAQSLQPKSVKEISIERYKLLFEESKTLGVSTILLAGGEPFMRPDIINLTKEFPEIIFPVFTNGTQVDENTISELEKNKNVIPIISIEGKATETDTRRGSGIYEKVMKNFSILKNRSLFWGVSITTTSQNIALVTSKSFIRDLTNLGCKIFFFVEYVPVKNNTSELCLATNQKQTLIEEVDKFKKTHKALFFAFPGDEEKYGGCMAAGRGFLHIGVDGSIEPCPFAPYSDVNINKTSLKNALQSNLLKQIRENHNLLTENNGGCTLWANKTFVNNLIINN